MRSQRSPIFPNQVIPLYTFAIALFAGRKVGRSPLQWCCDWLGDRISEISSSDRASFSAGYLGQRLNQFFAQTIADFPKLDYFSSNPCDRPTQQRKNRAIAFFLAMVAIASANASKMAEYSSF
jgi:hypothetical protein